MYEDPSLASAQEPQMPWTMTWGIDNPILNIAAFMGMQATAKYLAGGRVKIPFVGTFGSKQALAKSIGANRRGPRGRYISGSGRKALLKFGEVSRKYGPEKWMGRVSPADVMSKRRLDRLKNLSGLGGGSVKFGGRAYARRVIFAKSLTKTFGGSAARRIMAYRGVSGLLGLANASFFAYMGASAIGALGSMIGNWTPGQPVNPRRQLETGGPIIDTPTAMTQRQRAIQAIHNSQISTRAALGNEASFMHYE